jgi:hypothetical protein
MRTVFLAVVLSVAISVFSFAQGPATQKSGIATQTSASQASVAQTSVAQTSATQAVATSATARPVVASAATEKMAAAQSATAAKRVDNEFVRQQFGDQFTLVPEVGAVFGDLDGDGVEDVVIAARCKNPMIDQAEHNYQVIDPLNSYYGFGDPRVTTTFSEGDPSRRGLVMLIIHGAGPEAWRSPKPKAKFVVVNLPYKMIYVRKLQLKKKMTIDALYIEEAGETGETSAVFFDPKKLRYLYVPMGGDME